MSPPPTASATAKVSLCFCFQLEAIGAKVHPVVAGFDEEGEEAETSDGCESAANPGGLCRV